MTMQTLYRRGGGRLTGLRFALTRLTEAVDAYVSARAARAVSEDEMQSVQATIGRLLRGAPRR